MIRAFVGLGLTATLVGHTHAKTSPAHVASKPPLAHASARPAEPLPMLPSVARVRVEAGRDRLMVLEEVNFPRGDWVSGGLDLYIAFGAPGVPIAVDARLVAVAPGASDSTLSDAGEPVAVEPSLRRSPPVRPLLGRPQMAGVVVHVKDAQLRRIYESDRGAALRIRSLLPAPAADASGARDTVVRLGVAGGLPLTVGHIQVVSLETEPWITRAEATLCGPEADGWPLSVTLLPKPSQPAPAPSKPPIAPAAALRHASDDLCIRWWATG
jgi:hypothetical protein